MSRARNSFSIALTAAFLTALPVVADQDEAAGRSRTVMVETADGAYTTREVREEGLAATGFSGIPLPRTTSASSSSATVWSVDDELAIGQSVAIDDQTIWGAWRLNGSRLGAYPIAGDGTPDFEFPSSLGPNAFTGVAAAKGADRVLFVERQSGNHRVQAFTSESDGVPDWTFEVPASTFAHARNLSVSHDGSTAAVLVRNNTTGTVHVFDADTGDTLLEWDVGPSTFPQAVELTDDGSLALVTHETQATVLDTETGTPIFTAPGFTGSAHYRISGDGSVFTVSGVGSGDGALHVYAFDGSTYERVIEFTPEGLDLSLATIVSRDGSTVGSFAIANGAADNPFLEGEVYVFDVASGELLGSHPVAGSGPFQGTPQHAAASDDGSVLAFASWGTAFGDWPEVMVFNRDAELIGQIEFPGSANAVAVTADGQFVTAAAKAVHANNIGNGGRIELIEIPAGGNPIPALFELEPASVPVASDGLELTIVGSGFRSGSVARFDGADRPTTFVDSHTLTVEIPASDLETVGAFPVTVFTPQPGGGVSAPLELEVTGVRATLTLDPESLHSVLPAGQMEAQPLTLSNMGEETLHWQVTDDGGVSGETTVTHSASLDILTPHSAACTPDGGQTTSANAFLRAFRLSDFDVHGSFEVGEVTFGVEALNVTVDIDVNLYTLDGELTYDNLSLIGTTTQQLEPQGQTLVTVPVAGTVPAGAVLVVEIAAPDLEGVGHFFAGSNDQGETAPSYIAAADCGFPQPATMAEIGRPLVHLVMTVTGEAETFDCAPAPWANLEPAGGSVPGADEQVTDLRFDAAGLDPGVFTANLCLRSNDPIRPLVAVPLTLEAVEGDQGFTPVALAVDDEVVMSDGNGVFEPGERVEAAPAWHNDDAMFSHFLTGTASDFTGPEGPDYTITTPHANYGEIGPSEMVSCRQTDLCYELDVAPSAERPATHWDALFTETLDDMEETSQPWTLHLGDSFADVPRESPFYRSIETLLHHGVTGGCSTPIPEAAAYCPTDANNRAQMAVFLLKAVEGADYLPPACEEGAEMFFDVPVDSLFCPWIHELANRDVTSGCGDGNYCPGDTVTRGQMAVFLLRAAEGGDYTPPECTGEFTDVECSSAFAAWVEELAERGITGGCSAEPPAYCPSNPVTRAQMATFVTRTFGLALYGP